MFVYQVLGTLASLRPTSMDEACIDGFNKEVVLVKGTNDKIMRYILRASYAYYVYCTKSIFIFFFI